MKQHVFISYSRKNSDFARQLIADLQVASVPYWIDLKGVSHYDSSFERSIRQAMDEAFAVLLIATPNSLESDYVQGEIDIALERKIPLIVVWAAGEHFTDTIPGRLSRRSYIDCRGERYVAEKVQIIEELIALRDAAIPAMTLSAGNIPNCCFTVRLPDKRQVIIREDAYNWLVDLLMDLFNYHLKDTFPEFSYGKAWVLTLGGRSFRLAVAPVELLSQQDKTWYKVSPQDLRLVAGVTAKVESLEAASLFALVVPNNEFYLIRHLRTQEQHSADIIAKYLHNRLKDANIPLAQLSTLDPKQQTVFVMYARTPQFDRKVMTIIR